MDKNTVTCTTCPLGCVIEVTKDSNEPSGYILKGNGCKRGADYAIAEVTNPTRVLTSTVKLKNSALKRLPVRTDRPISKKLIFACMKEINRAEAKAPVKIGDVIIKNILGTGANVISSRTV